MVGDVVEVRPGRRLAFAWWAERPFGLPRRSRVELTLERRGHATVLRLRESQLAAPPVAIALPGATRDQSDADGDRPRLVGAVR